MIDTTSMYGATTFVCACGCVLYTRVGDYGGRFVRGNRELVKRRSG